MTTREPVVVVQDPYHPYAIRFLEVHRQVWGLRSVCWYTDEAMLRSQAWQYPWLASPAVARNYLVGTSGLDGLAAALRRDFDVRAVVPYAEPTVLPAAALSELLGLSWAQPGVLELFRDKYRIKERLRAVEGIRVNATALVRSGAEVLETVGRLGLDRFVLKPNDGFGNSRIGFFTADSPVVSIDGYLRQFGGDQVLLEEFVEGDEYFVNGQTDADGRVTTIAVFAYRREPANGRDNLETETRLVRTGDPGYSAAVDYAERVVRATALRRSPFHLELLLDERGPCLVEVAARLAGGGNAVDMNIVHGKGLDVFAVAAHGYVTDEEHGALPLDWQAYDRRAYRKLSGISSAEERIYEIAGVAEVEALPEFVRWVHEPRVGDRVERTLDIMTLP